MKTHGICLTIVSMIGLLLFSAVIWADDSDNNVSEEEVVVTASRTAQPEAKAPGKTEVITKEEIEASGATTVAEALEGAGGKISSYGGKSGVASIQLDGSDASRTLVLINGIPANTGCSDSVDLRYFPTAGIRRIEVAHGPLSVLYGSNAMGGVVNIITDLTGEPMNQINQSSGSFRTQSTDLLVQRLNWGLAIGGSTTNGYREYSENYDNYVLGQYDFFELEDEYLKLNWQVLSAHGHFPGSLSAPSEDRQSEKRSQIDLSGRNKFWGGSWEYKVYGQYLNYQYDSNNPYGSSYAEHQTTKTGVDMAGFYQLGSHEIISGFTMKQDHFNSTDSGVHTQNNEALFVQDSWSLIDFLTLVSGVRWDRNSAFSSPISPRISLVSTLLDQFSIKVGYGKTFKAPTVNDLYYNDAYSKSNPNLKAETGERYDLIGEWKSDHQTAVIDMFLSNLKDGIIWESDDDTGIWSPINVNKVRSMGITLKWEKTWIGPFSTTFGYNWIDKEGYNSTNGEYDVDLNTLGKQQLDLGLKLNYHVLQYGLNWNFVKDRSNDLPDYDVLNWNVKYLVNRNLSFAFVTNNAADQYYEVNKDYPMPGRSYTLSTKYTF